MVSRRAILGAAVGAASLATISRHGTASANGAVSAEEALQRLLDGNRRFVTNTMVRPNQSPRLRAQLATGQSPWALVLSCLDSRIPPELVFDQGLGDLFVARVAGNIVTDEIEGSMEFAVAEINVPLIVVMGHDSCGAIKASIDAIQANVTAPGNISTLVEAIRPAVAYGLMTGDPINETIRANVLLGVNRVTTSDPILAPAYQAGTIKVVGMHYRLATGAVEVIS